MNVNTATNSSTTTNRYIHLNTFILDPMDEGLGKFANQFVSYKNTLLQDLYSTVMLTNQHGTEKIRGYEGHTPLFIVDCSYAIKWHINKVKSLNGLKVTLRQDPKVIEYIKLSTAKQWSLAKKLLNNSNVAQYKSTNAQLKELGELDQFIQRKLEQLDQYNMGQVVFASSSRKDGKVFAYNRVTQQSKAKWFDLMGNKAISHGNNLVSDNHCPPIDLTNLNVLLVDDDDKQLMDTYGLGDCHGVINYRHTSTLGAGKVYKDPFQFRGFFHQRNWVCKGVLRPANLGDIDLVLPLSSFKVDSKILPTPLEAGTYQADIKLAIHKPAKATWAGFGLNAQYFSSAQSIQHLVGCTRNAMLDLNQYRTEWGEWNLSALADVIIADSKREDFIEGKPVDQEEQSMYLRLGQVLKADQYGILSQHPYVVSTVKKWLASKLRKTALTGGITQRYLLACPMPELAEFRYYANIVVVNDKQFAGNEAVLSRFPLRNRNDLQQVYVINLADVWPMVSTSKADDDAVELGIIDAPTEQVTFSDALYKYLEHIGFVSQEVEVIHHAIMRRGAQFYSNCFWVSPQLWATFGGDFDGDYGCLLSAHDHRPLYDEVGTWKRLPECTKPPKKPLTGTLPFLAARSFQNDIGSLSSVMTALGCNHYKVIDHFSNMVMKSINDIHSAGYLYWAWNLEVIKFRKFAVRVAEQMQLAVDSFKSEITNDKELLTKWNKQCYSIRKFHWVGCYKDRDLYLKDGVVLPSNCHDSIGRMIAVVNSLHPTLKIKTRKLQTFVDLFPMDSDRYKQMRDMVFEFQVGSETHQWTLGDFYSSYQDRTCALAIKLYDEDGNPIKTYKDDDGLLVHNSDTMFQIERTKRAELLEQYAAAYKQLVFTNPTLADDINTTLWRLAHYQDTNRDGVKTSGKSKAPLAFYVLCDTIIDVISTPKTVGMKLVSADTDLFSLASRLHTRSFEVFLEPEFESNNLDSPMLLSFVDMGELDYIGKVYPAPRSNLIKHQSLVVAGGYYMAKISYIKSSGINHHYELSIKLQATKSVEEMGEADHVDYAWLETMTVNEMISYCKGHGISGYSKKKKAELIDHIKQHLA